MGRNTREHALTVTRERLLEVGDRLFADEGYIATSIEMVVTEAGFTRGAFYRHFASKEDFFLALMERRSARQRAEWAEMVAADDRASPGDVAGWYAMNIERQQGFDAAVQEFVAYGARQPELLERLQQREAELLDAITMYLPSSAPNGISQEELAALVVAVGEGLANQLTHSTNQKARLFATAVTLLTGGTVDT